MASNNDVDEQAVDQAIEEVEDNSNATEAVEQTEDSYSFLPYILDALNVLSEGFGSDEVDIVSDVLTQQPDLDTGDENTYVFEDLDSALADGTLLRPYKGSTKVTLGCLFDDSIAPVLSVWTSDDCWYYVDDVVAAVSPSTEESAVWLSVVRKMIAADYLEANDQLQLRLSDGYYRQTHNGRDRVRPRVSQTSRNSSGAAIAGDMAAIIKKPLTLYNEYMKHAVTDVKLSNPQLTHKEAFAKAAVSWHTSEENPKHAAKMGLTDTNKTVNNTATNSTTETFGLRRRSRRQ